MTEQEVRNNAAQIRTLLVEDHALTRVGIRVTLERFPDITVVGEASNGLDGAEAFERLRPDVVLMDVGMPQMDGIEAARRILERYADAKIIMLTSHNNDGDIFASLAAGASGYCLKDATPERLHSAVVSVSLGDVWLDSAIASRVLQYYARPQTSLDGDGAAPAAAAVPENLVPISGNSQTERLSQRELEVLTLIVQGLSNQAIADSLKISLATTKSHVRSILHKLAVDDRTEAAVQAMRKGLV
jgi:DNA-binding NarL/FixJ family response regulator